MHDCSKGRRTYWSSRITVNPLLLTVNQRKIHAASFSYCLPLILLLLLLVVVLLGDGVKNEPVASFPAAKPLLLLGLPKLHHPQVLSPHVVPERSHLDCYGIENLRLGFTLTSNCCWD